MNYKIEEVEGIGPTYKAKLTECGVQTTDDLLARCGDRSGRKKTAEESGIGEAHLLTWANMADMMRVNGIGKQFAELLQASGVDTVKELATRRADNLATKLKEVNEAKKLARSTPTADQVQGWVDEAKGMTPVISH